MSSFYYAIIRLLKRCSSLGHAFSENRKAGGLQRNGSLLAVATGRENWVIDLAREQA
jgi:hypothetical protein